MDKIAIISDIHGNMQALDAVLDHIKSQGIDTIYCLGDLPGKGPDGDLAVDKCRDVCDVIIRGNWDDGITKPQDWDAAIWWQERLGQERLDYLANLPNCHDFVMSGKRIRLYHASHISEHHRIHAYQSLDVYRPMFTNTDFTGHDTPPPDIVGYGDIHAAYMIYADTGKFLFNTGSVGNPLDMNIPVYAILSGDMDSTQSSQFNLEFVRVPYDIEAAIQRAVDLNMPETEAYARELRTAIYRGRQS